MSAQDAGVQDENLNCACTWFFRAKARLSPSKTRKNVLHSRRNRQKECIDAVLDIMFACFDIVRPDLGTALIEDYVYASFCLGSVFVLVPNTVTRRSSVSCHAEKIQHSNRLSLINFYRESKVEDLIVSLIASLCQFVGLAHMTCRAAEKCVERWCNAFEIQYRILQDFFYVPGKTFHHEKW